jgi:hypothetical protein
MTPLPTTTVHRHLSASGWLVVVLTASMVVAVGVFLRMDRRHERAPAAISADPLVLQAHQSYVNGKALYAKAMEMQPGDPRVELFRQAQGFFATARDAYHGLGALHPQDASLALHEQEAKDFLANCRNFQLFIGR